MYEKVFPVETTGSRNVPNNIARPDYVLNNENYKIPIVPEIKDAEQLAGMRRSCLLASNILTRVEKIIKVNSLFIGF